MRRTQGLRKNIATIVGAASLVAGSALVAGDGGKVIIDDKGIVEPEAWTICNVFDYSTLYDNDANPYIQKISLIGRYHGQWHHIDGAGDLEDQGWEDRRWRLGTKIEFLENFTFETNFNVEHDSDRFFEDIDDMVIEWEPAEDLVIVIGKQKPRITQEYATSSKRIITFERSQAVNQVVPDKLWGVSVEKGFGAITQELGVYTGGYDDDWAFPDFDGGAAILSRTAYEVSDVTTARLDYFWADQDPESNGVSGHEHVVSLGTDNDFGGWGVITDLIYGSDDGDHGDIFSVVIMPHVDLTDKLELVGRYTFSTSSSDEGVRLQSRYERAADFSDRGDTYHALYGGLNYRLCGDKLKLMTGVEWSTLSGGSDDFDGFTYFAGVRTYF